MSNAPFDADQAAEALEIENAIFEAALQISEAEARSAFLDRIFRGDPDGREAMDGLLRMAGSSSAFFLEGKRHAAELAREVIEEIPEPPAEDASEGDDTGEGERVGSQIGRYRLLKKIGEGGAGEIFEAEQEGMVRTVALKIIRSGMDTGSVVARFESERHALELMEHPNISRVLDAGRTAMGRPYFVMELVKGSRITEYSEAAGLPLGARLELFLAVCQAIQHAHQKGIVHRDIKPSNILVETVDGKPVPKVIDFGIAKAMEGRLRGGNITHLDQFVGTPAYMSPEQVDMSGMDIDTRADIYSLGVVLFELLAGRPPFESEELQRLGMTEMRRAILEDRAPLPSESALSAASGEKRAAQLRGELDWVVCKAMEKERQRRYQTVDALASDIRRYLRNEPVTARKPSRGYALKKFFQRHRTSCLLAAALLLGLVAGLGTITGLYFREKEALAQQERLERQTQARANVSHAAILLSEGNIEQADQMLRQDPPESIEASPEAAEVFRALGRWNAVFSRWEQAASCFLLMNEANRMGVQADVVEGLDLLMTAPVLLEAGKKAEYQQFRAMMLDRYTPARSALEAEHLLKVCLLLPADKATLDRLEESAQVCRANTLGKSGRRSFKEWNALSLALFHYRKGEMEKAVHQAETCLKTPDNAGSRASAARCVLAMAQHRLGRTGQARQTFERARSDLRRVESLADDSGFPPIGTWFAWSVVRVLSREAGAAVAR